MSVVVYRDGIMAADTGSFRGDIMFTDTRTKIAMLDGILIGGVGSTPVVAQFINQVRQDPEHWRRTPIRDDMSAILVVHMDGGLPSLSLQDGEISASQVDPLWEDLGPVEYFAMGAAYEVAYGALGAGADAATTVRICAKFHKSVGSGVVAVHLAPTVGAGRDLAALKGVTGAVEQDPGRNIGQKLSGTLRADPRLTGFDPLQGLTSAADDVREAIKGEVEARPNGSTKGRW